MKAFWIIIALLAIVGIWLMWKPAGNDSPTALDDAAIPQSAPAQPQPVAPPPATTDDRATAAQPASNTTEPTSAKPTSPEITPDPAQALVDDLLSADAPASPPPGSHEGHAGTSGSNVPSAPVITIDPDSIPTTTGPAKIERQEDGSFLVDDKYVIRGDGSPQNPYQLTWDLLVSASKTYQPRAGLTEIPDRIKMLDGKHIRITGYFAFPLAVQQTDEALVMMNMWDGCCIGVPPSPYDAIEVRLTEPVALAAKRFFNYGTLEGVLKVDPYIVNDWLLGLYLVENGVLEWGGL